MGIWAVCEHTPPCLPCLSIHRSSSHSCSLAPHTGHSAPPRHIARTGHGTCPLSAAPRGHTLSSHTPPCSPHKPCASCRSRGCSDTACRACVQSRALYRGTAPHDNREVLALWVQSVTQLRIGQGQRDVPKGPAVVERRLYFPDQESRNHIHLREYTCHYILHLSHQSAGQLKGQAWTTVADNWPSWSLNLGR